MQISLLCDNQYLYDSVIILLQSEWSYEYSVLDGLYTNEDYRKYLETSICYVAHKNDILFGVVIIADKDWGIREDLTPWLATIIVTPEYRNNGVATNLIQYVLYKYKKLYLWTDKEPLKAFYERYGFTQIDIIKNHKHFKDIYVLKSA